MKNDNKGQITLYLFYVLGAAMGYLVAYLQNP